MRLPARAGPENAPAMAGAITLDAGVVHNPTPGSGRRAHSSIVTGMLAKPRGRPRLPRHTSRESDLVSRHWGKKPPAVGANYYTFRPLVKFHCESIAGSTLEVPPDADWTVKWTLDTYLHRQLPVSECLSLCCGFGEIERALARHGAFVHCTGLDISNDALEAARSSARTAGLESVDYEQADLNTLTLKPNAYDLVWANGAMHHIRDLEHLVEQVYGALKPGGLFVCNEYVGPPYQELGLRQREIVNSVVHLLPARLRAATEETFVSAKMRWPQWRRAVFRLATGRMPSSPPSSAFMRAAVSVYRPWSRVLGGLLRGHRRFHYSKVWDVDSQWLRHVDPSECVRSDEVIPVLKALFGEIDVRYYGGSILVYALDHKFYESFDQDSPSDMRLLESLVQLERTLLEIGELQPDHAHVIARKPATQSVGADAGSHATP